MSNEDLWGGDFETEESSGFRAPFHPFAGKVTRADFATDAGYMNGEVYRLRLSVDVSRPGGGPVVKPNHEIWIGLGGRREDGTDWTSPDGGKTVVNRSGAEKFNSFSGLGRCVAALAKLGKAGDPQANAWRRAVSTTRAAAAWEGHTFLFDDVDIPGPKQPDGTRASRTFELIVGVEAVGGGQASPAAGNGTSDEFEAKAKELAVAAASFEDFKDAAMAAGLASGDVNRFKSRILAESGVWAEVRGA